MARRKTKTTSIYKVRIALKLSQQEVEATFGEAARLSQMAISKPETGELSRVDFKAKETIVYFCGGKKVADNFKRSAKALPRKPRVSVATVTAAALR